MREVQVSSSALRENPDPVLGALYPEGDLINRDARFYEDPERFAPERWLNGRPSGHKFAYLSFAAGIRRCLGESLALVALTGLLPALTRDWRLTLGPVRFATGLYPQLADDVHVTLRRRRG